MAQSHQYEKSGKEKFLETFSGFLYKNKIFFITLLTILAAGLIALAIILTVRQNRAEKGAAIAEDIQEYYSEWSGLTDEEEERKEESEQLILDMTEELVESYDGTFAAQRGLLVSGELLFRQESWEEAAQYFTALATGYPESYLAPVALASASSAYENADMTDEALQSAEAIINTYADTGASVEAPRAFFTVGRLREKKGDLQGALEAYRELVGKFPESSWTKLAQDRIIVLEPEE